jgi:hypothetical protein
MTGGVDAFLLSFGLPSAADSRLLRACLGIGGQPEATTESLLAALTDPQAARRWMLPLLADRLEREGRLDGREGIKLRAAALHEKGRTATFDTITAAMLVALEGAGCSALLSRGHALALTAYARSALRHRHDLDLLVDRKEMSMACAALERTGLSRSGAGDASGSIVLQHPSGLGVKLHDRPVPCNHAMLTFAALRAGATTGRMLDAPFLMPDPTDLLLHILLLSACSPPHALAWVADAVTVIGEKRIEWHRIASVEGADTFDVLARLAYLAGAIGVSVPNDVLATLRFRISGADRTTRDAALSRARRRGGIRAMIRQGSRYRATAALLRWAAGQPVPIALPWQPATRGKEANIAGQER